MIHYINNTINSITMKYCIIAKKIISSDTFLCLFSTILYSIERRFHIIHIHRVHHPHPNSLGASTWHIHHLCIEHTHVEVDHWYPGHLHKLQDTRHIHCSVLDGSPGVFEDFLCFISLFCC